MNLVIVESPTKAKTIKQFLGKDYMVKSSFGHIRDLPARELAIDIENNFKPKYVIMPKAKKTITDLKQGLNKETNVILATDEDREGEAIAFHLTKALKLENAKRIVFHEITKEAIEKALKSPREIDKNLVNAQQARRVLDRLVGYKLSPLLWKKVARGLSAGRVQSIAVRLIVERQKEIDDFKPQEYWTIEVDFENEKKEKIAAKLNKKNGKTIPSPGIKTKKETNEIVQELKKFKYSIEKVEKKETKKYPLPPFTTSTLQQEASRKLRFSAKQTMFIAQQLYEGIALEKNKSAGLITYMRTDSLNMANQAVEKIRDLIEKNIGKEYLPLKPNFYKTKTKGAQEAHEAIRPTFPEKKPEDLKDFLNEKQWSLYNLIWQRSIACQMNPAIFDSTAIDIKTNKSDSENVYELRSTGNIIKFDGFLKIWPIKSEERVLPELKEKEILELLKINPSQHFTQSSPPYTEATLVKSLEENGIGRPSTYAPTMDTIQKRGYIGKKVRYLYPTEIGTLVNNLLVEHFPKIVDIKFTAKMEDDLDDIADGKIEWIPIIRKFYTPFEKNLKQKYEEIEKKKITEEKSDEICEKCGSPMIIKLGRFGKFLACSGFPKCKNTKPIEKSSGVICPECGQGEIIERTSKRGRIFYSCNKYPACKFALWDLPINEKCPKCKSILVKTRGNKIKCSNKECGFIKE